MESKSLSRRGSRGLLQLPPEILTMIMTNFCHHCPPCDAIGVGRHDPQCLQTLLSLCTTSRMLREIAQPFIYHYISNDRVRTKMPKFFRTLKERPDLALHIKKFHREQNVSFNPSLFSVEQMQVIKTTARLLCMERVEDPNFEFLGENIEVEVKGEFFFELLVAMASGLEGLRMNLELSGQLPYSHFYFLHQRATKLGPLAAMTRLKFIQFEKATAHKVPFDTPAVTALLRLSPNLEHLRFMLCTNSIGGSGRIFQDSAPRPLRIVQMDRCNLEDNESTRNLLNDIVSHAPNLQHFGFNCQKTWIEPSLEPHLAFPGFLDCLRPVNSTLVAIDIDLTFHAYAKIRSEVVREGVLHSFTNLEQLSINDTAVCRHLDEPSAGPTCFVDNIPPKLRELTVRMSEDTPAWKDAVRLAAEAKRFPNLEKVTLVAASRVFTRHIKNGFRTIARSQGGWLKESFARSSVEFEVEIRTEYELHQMGSDFVDF